MTERAAPSSASGSSSASEPSKRLVRPMPKAWWISKPSWFLFLLRELSSVFVAVFVVTMIVLVRRLADGPAAYEEFLAWSRRPAVIGYHVVALAFVLDHTATWFLAAPKAMRLRLGEEPVPPLAVIAGHYAAWLVASAAIAWLLLRGS